MTLKKGALREKLVRVPIHEEFEHPNAHAHGHDDGHGHDDVPNHVGVGDREEKKGCCSRCTDKIRSWNENYIKKFLIFNYNPDV